MTYNTFTNAKVPFLQYPPPYILMPSFSQYFVLYLYLSTAFFCRSYCYRPANWLNEAFKSPDWSCTI